MHNRREFIARASLSAAGLAAGGAPLISQARVANKTGTQRKRTFKYRIAFGAWMNDMRCEPLPLENWPAPQFDDECVRSLIRIIDLQSQAGYNVFDVWGLFPTHGRTVAVLSRVGRERRSTSNP